MVIENPGFPFLTAIGTFALINNTTGSHNTASGFQALLANTSGTYNTATGLNALVSNTSGSFNTATGAQALLFNNGNFNTANGVNALVSNTSGSSNTASGYLALSSNTTGSNNTAAGVEALFSNTTGRSNTASGYRALCQHHGRPEHGQRDRALFSNITASSTRPAAILRSLPTHGGQHGQRLRGALATRATTTPRSAPMRSATRRAPPTRRSAQRPVKCDDGRPQCVPGRRGLWHAVRHHTIRLGRPYNGTVGQNQTFIAGIYGSPLSGTAHVVYIDANGQLGTVAVGGGGGGFLPMSQLQQPVREQDKPSRDQPSVNADLRGQIAKLVATNADLRAQIAQLHATDGDLRIRLGRLEAALARVAAGK